MSPLSIGSHQSRSLANSLSSFWVTACGSFVVEYFMSSTLNGTNCERLHQWVHQITCFFSPRVQLNIHLAQTSMWLLVVRSPRSDEECPGAGRQGTFNRTQRDVVRVFLSRSQHGFHSAVGGVVSTCFVAKPSLQSACSSALMGPTAE